MDIYDRIVEELFALHPFENVVTMNEMADALKNAMATLKICPSPVLQLTPPVSAGWGPVTFHYTLGGPGHDKP